MSQMSKSCRMVLSATEEKYSRVSGVHGARGGTFPILNGPAMGERGLAEKEIFERCEG